MAGGFFGGLSEGITQAQQDALAKQKQDALEQNNAKASAIKQIDATLTQITDLAKAAAANGNDPQKIAAAAQPLIQSAQGLAQAAGIDPAMVAQRANVALMHPGEPSDKKHTVVKIGSGTDAAGATRDQYGVLEQNSGKITPIQPQLAQSDVITPGQVARANPPQPTAPAPAAAPTAAPVAATPAAPDGTPAQTIAMRFPSPAQGGTQAQPAQAVPAGPTLPPTMQPGGEAIDYAIKNNINGPEFLKAVPPQARNTVSGITDYKVDPDKLSKRTDKSGQSEYTRMLSWAHQADPNYDPKYYKPMQRAITEFTSGGNTSPAGQITVGNTAIAHGGQVADAIDKIKAVPGLLQKMEASGTPFVSYAASALKNAALRGTSEGAALQAFKTASEHFVDETTKFYAGGQPAEAGRERGLQNFNAAKSTAELYQSLNSEAELLSGKVGALQDRWKTAMAGPRMGDLLFRNSIPDFPILSENSKTALDRIGQGYLASKYKGNIPGSQPSGVVDFSTYFGK